MAPISQQIAEMVEILPDADQELARGEYVILFSNEKLCFVTGRKALELLPFRANTKFFLILFLSRKSIRYEDINWE